MSASAVQEFLDSVQTDESLAQELVKALEAENDRESVTALATSKGYDITSEELWAEVKKRQEELNERQGAGELSDEELEAVAGGEFVVGSIVISILTGAAAGYLVNQIPPIKW
ncbi:MULTISPECIES: Nif11-like leader peptide family natural product precursor [Pseudanabaena]|jgi:predicted ribosomally synthesized peptide with nif11-like leader|uniref:Nif11-like leader peptide family natural product precursor n=1 Tax=Pseudanabaena TaxID=1152 RepID=UPI00247B0701|nr:MULTISPECIES: Nif11-like leader peptide family natural product precursor [Pseudanabaena]MEA5488029.1 Nif11-like leader peptide family natural product precursor [Pseudanabaena sp. CCNP1317]WGS75156.1 Nif11-like leader peptide family natural product precursor [Pseudanabaena galeata CCNP1313]